MNENERRVLEAARRMVLEEGSFSDLRDAVEALEENRCPAKGILGDPAWPVMVSCDKDAGHAEEFHRDPARGIEWRSAR